MEVTEDKTTTTKNIL